MSYHKIEIPKGAYGDFSKLQEEWLELKDAHQQGIRVMELCELSDLIGAIEGYSVNKFGITLNDLIKMKDATKIAFETGYRK